MQNEKTYTPQAWTVKGNILNKKTSNPTDLSKFTPYRATNTLEPPEQIGNHILNQIKMTANWPPNPPVPYDLWMTRDGRYSLNGKIMNDGAVIHTSGKFLMDGTPVYRLRSKKEEI